MVTTQVQVSALVLVPGWMSVEALARRYLG